MDRKLAFAKSVSEDGVPCATGAITPAEAAAGHMDHNTPTLQAKQLTSARKYWLLVAGRVMQSQANRLRLVLETQMSRTRAEHERLQRVAAMYTMTRLRTYNRDEGG